MPRRNTLITIAGLVIALAAMHSHEPRSAASLLIYFAGGAMVLYGLFADDKGKTRS